MKELSRREFIRNMGLAGAGIAALGAAGCKSGFTRTLAAAESPLQARAPKVSVDGVYAAKGDDPAAMIRAAVEEAGGISKFVKKGNKVIIKPNIGFDRRPEFAATTNPLLIATLVGMCIKAGAANVTVFDRPCDDEKRCYLHSGIAKAAEDAGAKVEFVRDDMFVDAKIPGSKALKRWPVHRGIMESDVFINVPIVKHHGQTGITLGMKNLMGCVGGQRGAWHVGTLSQRIAEINSFMRPDLVVIDAFRILKDHGPTGGSKDDVKMVNTIAVATDIVAADAYGAKLFGSAPSDVEYINIAYKMKLGEMDLKKIKIREVKA